MPEFQTLGWEDWEGNVHWGAPTNIADVQGMFNVFWDEQTGTEHRHWVYLDPPPFTDWNEWYDLIDGTIEDCGYS